MHIETLKHVSGGKEFPLTYQQQRIWFLSFIDKEGNIWNEYLKIHINGFLDIKILKKSIACMLKRYDVLRTNFKIINGVPKQVISKNLNFELKTYKITEENQESAKNTINGIIGEENSKPFNLENEVLIKFLVFELGGNKSILCIIRHYLISDARADKILIGEILNVYYNLKINIKLKLEPVKFTYTDFAVWQKEFEKSDLFSGQKNYWQKELEGITFTNMHTDFTRPSELNLNGIRICGSIDNNTTQILRKYSVSNRITLSTVILSAFSLLVSKYSNQKKVIIGDVFEGRTLMATLKKIVGLFTNTLPILINIDGLDTFLELCFHVNKKTQDAYNNQYYPFEYMVKDINYKRDTSHAPIFQILFNYISNTSYQNYDTGSFIEECKTQMDIDLRIVEYKDNISYEMVFNRGLYEISTAQKITGQFIRILDEVKKNIGFVLKEYSLIDNNEKDKILNTFNSTDKNFKLDVNIYDLFINQANKTPDKTAIVYKSKNYTFKELLSAINNISEKLTSQGIKKNSKVGLYFERSPEYIASLIAILKLGAIYVPIDTAYPEKTILHIINEARFDLVLTNIEFSNNNNLFKNYILINEDIFKTENLNVTAPVFNHISCIMFTSGSTGQPKGIILNTTGILNRLNWFWRVFPFENSDVAAVKTSIGFVDSFLEILAPLLKGIKCIVIPNEAGKDAGQICQSIIENKISRLILVPSLLDQILDYFDFKKANIGFINSVYCSGEALSAELVKKWNKITNNKKLVNIYGSTEVSGDATYYIVDNNTNYESVPIGKPIDNSKVFILDNDLNLMPVGVKGLIHVSGLCMSDGYLNNDSLNKEKFINNPYSQDSNLYNIGDVGCLTNDGNIEYKGRNDHQVKIRGYRIELEGIESAIRSIPGIVHSAVTLQKTGNNDVIVCYYTTQSDLSIFAIKQELQRILPDYMVPSHFIQLQKMPLQANNKVNRKEVEKINFNETDKKNNVILPETKFEKEIFEIWKEVLEYQNLSMTDNFFDVGGHSLLLSKLILKIEFKYNVRVEYRDFINNTLGQFAKHLEKKYSKEHIIV